MLLHDFPAALGLHHLGRLAGGVQCACFNKSFGAPVSFSGHDPGLPTVPDVPGQSLDYKPYPGCPVRRQICPEFRAVKCGKKIPKNTRQITENWKSFEGQIFLVLFGAAIMLIYL